MTHILHKQKIYITKTFKVDEDSKIVKESPKGNLTIEQVEENLTPEYLNELIERRMSMPVIRVLHDAKKIKFNPAQKSFFASIYDKFIGGQSGEECDVTEYDVENICIYIIRQSDHIDGANSPDVEVREEPREDGKVNLVIKTHSASMSEEQYFNSKKYKHVYQSDHISKTRKK